MPYDDLYEKHGNRVGIDPAILKRFAQIENSERARGCTGSYCGLFQLSQSEFKRNGGTGSIFDPEQNTMAAANKLAQESRNFRDKYGRDPKGFELYLIHNQGEAGFAAHASNPQGLAQDNMASTGEGRSKGYNWAGKAVAWNTPGGTAQYGGLRHMTSEQFVTGWERKFEGQTGGQYAQLSGRPEELNVKPEDEWSLAGQAKDMGAVSTEAVDESDPEAGKRRAGRGVADADESKTSLVNKQQQFPLDTEEMQPAFRIGQFQVPDLVPKFGRST